MIDWQQFHFIRPWWLAALLPLAVLLYFVATRRVGSRGWAAVCDPALLPHVLIGKSGTQARRPLILGALCGFVAILAMAGPAWSRLPQPLYSSGQALVIALDLSRSMDAADLSPSRAVRARYKVKDILESRKEGLSGLIVYAGDAFTVAPLTDDVNTIIAQLGALSTEIMPVQGSRADLAMRLAAELLRGGGQSRGEILLIADEVDGERDSAAAAKLRDDGYRVSVLASATAQGGPIVLGNGSYLKDSRGEIVIPNLDEAPMRRVAEAGGGQYQRLSLDDTDVKRITASLDDLPLREESEVTGFRADLWEEQGPWLVVALLPLAALWFRRGYLFVILVLLLPVPRPAEALSWDDLWLRQDQQAHRALEEGDAARAAELFKRKDWKGAAQYRAGDYGAAGESLADLRDGDSRYNHGNALARAGRLEEAVAAYDEALKLNPGNEDALYNRKVVEEELKKQQQQQQQQQQQGQQGQQQQQASGQDGEQQQQPGEQRNGDPKDSDDRQAQADGNEPAASKDESSEAQAGDEMKDQAAAKPEEKKDEQAAGGRPEDSEGGAGDTGDESRLATTDQLPDEEQQAMEQWLRRIPDDPAGLLRRKFQYQYQQRQPERAREEQAW